MTKSLAVLSASLVLVAVSTSAYAGQTISDRNYLPGQSRPADTRYSANQPMTAFGAMVNSPRALVGDGASNTQRYQYQGGPKSSY